MVGITENKDAWNDRASSGGTEIKLRLLNAMQSRILLKLLPTMGEEPVRQTSQYLSRVLGYQEEFVEENLDFLYEKEMVSVDDDEYYLSTDNIMNINMVLDGNITVILNKKVKGYLND